jgi:hypothetical protein
VKLNISRRAGIKLGTSGIKLTIVQIILGSNALLVNVFVVPLGLDVAPKKMVMSPSMEVRRVRCAHP